MSGPFKMKNSMLKMSAKTGSPMQANYNAAPTKIIAGVLGALKGASKVAGTVKSLFKKPGDNNDSGTKYASPAKRADVIIDGENV